MGTIPNAIRTTYLGHPFEYPAGSDLGRLVADGHEWDAVLVPIIQAAFAGPTPFICEVGSNIGTSTRQILKAAPGARVLCFEPIERFRLFLERNLALAGQAAEILPYIAGNRGGKAVLLRDGTTGSVVREPRFTIPEEAPVIRLDDVMARRPRLDFLKIDTDGYDFEVVRGAEQTIRRDQPVITIEYTPAYRRYGGPNGLRRLQGMGYRRLHLLDPAGHYLLSTDDANEAHARSDQHIYGTYCDILACAAGSEAEARLERRLVLRPGALPVLARE
ncbi:MAG: FkbM family methyltransferase [Dehalococcoidia bacterium]